MNIENIKGFMLIEATRLATDNVNIVCWEANDAVKILEIYKKRKKWNEETEELYDTKTHFQFRKIMFWPSSENIDTYQISIEEIQQLSNS